MHPFAPLTLTAEDKLDSLRYLDEFRYWHSLDDQRRCRRCFEIITGHQILIFEFKGRRGGMRLHCPTPGCLSSPSEWVYADPVLAATLKSDFRPRLDLTEKAALKPSPRPDGRKRQAKNGRSKKTKPLATKHPLRAAAARLQILRSLASGLHAIHPVV